MTRLLMFDIDGTLTTTDRVDTECYVQAMSDYLGVAIDGDWSRYRHVTDSGIAAELFEVHRRAPHELSIVRERFIEHIKHALERDPKCCEQVPGAASIIMRLRHTPGWIVGLATGGWSDSAKIKLRWAGLEVEDLPFASADDAEARIEIMKTCLAQAKRVAGPVTDFVYVGDGAWDVQASQSLGWRFIGIGQAIRTIRQRDGGTYPVFSDYTDADSILEAASAG